MTRHRAKFAKYLVKKRVLKNPSRSEREGIATIAYAIGICRWIKKKHKREDPTEWAAIESLISEVERSGEAAMKLFPVAGLTQNQCDELERRMAKLEDKHWDDRSGFQVYTNFVLEMIYAQLDRVKVPAKVEAFRELESVILALHCQFDPDIENVGDTDAMRRATAARKLWEMS